MITEETEHGKGLVCSFAECRNAGVKFRYCRFCQDAVARRNFKHHQHTDLLEAERGLKISENPPKLGDSGIREEAHASDDDNDNDNDDDESTSSKECGSKMTASSERSEVVLSPDHADLKPSRKRRKAWARLLTKRPRSNDASEMCEWLEKVKAVSDFGIPSHSDSSSNTD